MAFCPSCGSEVGSSANVCDVCGMNFGSEVDAPATEPSPETMTTIRDDTTGSRLLTTRAWMLPVAVAVALMSLVIASLSVFFWQRLSQIEQDRRESEAFIEVAVDTVDRGISDLERRIDENESSDAELADEFEDLQGLVACIDEYLRGQTDTC